MIGAPTSSIRRDWLVWLFGALFFVLCIAYALRPIGDLDFWWHLKTGDEMLRTGGLLSADPFNYTGDQAAVSLREKCILRGYWLWEIVASTLFGRFGVPGIWFLSGITIVALYGTVACRLATFRVSRAVALPLLVASVFLFAYFFLERPQIVSFLFMLILLGLLENVWHGGKTSLWLFPLMALWPNVHGGVVFGVIVLGLFAVGCLWDERGNPQRRRHLILWAVGGIVATLASPNTYEGYLTLFGPSTAKMFDFVKEYQTTLQIFQEQTRWIALLWALVAIHFWALWKSRRFVWMEMLPTLFLAWASVAYMRNVPFFAVSMIPVTAHTVSAALRHEENTNRARGVAVAALAILLVLTGGAVKNTWNHLDAGSGVDNFFPRKMVGFLSRSNVSGNIFNDYGWGGYMIWALAPRFKLFIDGRGIDEQTFFDYMAVSSASLKKNDGQEAFRKLLNDYQIDYIVQPNHKDGLMQPLMKQLLNDPQWDPVYQDGNGYIMVRRNGKNQKLVDEYRIDKKQFLHKLRKSYDQTIKAQPSNADYYLGRGELLAYLGDYGQAFRDFEAVRRMNPSHPFLEAKIRQAEALRNLSETTNGMRP